MVPCLHPFTALLSVRRMGLSRGRRHWFSFKNSGISLIEYPALPGTSLMRSSLLFLHGRFGQAEMWNPLVEELSTQCRCLTLDLPGFGRSFFVRERAFSLLDHAQLVNELLRRFISLDEKVILIGHDIGGGIAQLSARQQSEKVAALILMNSIGLSQSLKKVKIGWKGWRIRRKLRQLLNESGNVQPSFKSALLQLWEKNESRKFLSQSLKAIDESWPSHYEQRYWKNAIQQMNQPVLLLWGKKDAMNSLELGTEMVQGFPDASIFVHDDSGHWPHLEQPQWVFTKMREFIFKTRSELQPKPVRKFLLK